MLLQNVKDITHEMVAQIMGQDYMEEKGYLQEIPAEKLVDVGKDVEKVRDNVEYGTKAIMSILARREIFTKEFRPLFKDIIISREEWGGYIERAKIDWADIMDDPAINLENGKDYSEYEHKYYGAKVISKIYNEAVGIMIPMSISRKSFMEAFDSYDAMNSYISKIKDTQRKTLLKAIDRYGAALVISAIVISTKATGTAVYLLDEALKKRVKNITESTTPEEALENPEYVKFVAKTISQLRSNMLVESTAYNNGNITEPSYENLLYILSPYINSYKFDLLSGLYNREEVGFGSYSEIPAWQAITEQDENKFEWDAISTVSLAADPQNKLGIGTNAVTVKNVLGVIIDKYAVGMTVFRDFMTSQYTASADFWTDFMHYLTNQLVDSDFPIVALINGRKSDSVSAIAAKATKNVTTAK